MNLILAIGCIAVALLLLIYGLYWWLWRPIKKG